MHDRACPNRTDWHEEEVSRKNLSRLQILTQVFSWCIGRMQREHSFFAGDEGWSKKTGSVDVLERVRRSNCKFCNLCSRLIVMSSFVSYHDVKCRSFYSREKVFEFVECSQPEVSVHENGAWLLFGTFKWKRGSPAGRVASEYFEILRMIAKKLISDILRRI